MAKEFLSRNGVPHTLRRLDDPESLAEIKRRWGYVTSPIVYIGDRAYPGFDAAILRPALVEAGLLGGKPAAGEVAPEVGPAPGQLSGRLAIAHFYGDQVGFVAPDSTDDARSVALDGHPAEVAYSAGAGVVAVTRYALGAVTLFASATGAPLHGAIEASTLAVGGTPLGIFAHPDEPVLYVGVSDPPSLVRIDLAAGTFLGGRLEDSRIPLPVAPYQLVHNAGEDLLYVGMLERGVAVLVGRTGRPRRGEIEASVLPTGGGRGIGLSADGKTLFRTKALNELGFLALYDAETGAPRLGSKEASWRPTGPLPLDMAVHPSLPIVYVSSLGDRTIALHDAETGDYLRGGAATSTVAAGAAVRGLLVDADGDTLYATSFDEDTVTLIDARTGGYRHGSRAASTVRTGRAPLGMRLLA
jgi:DNA-binding beta-propeller fold protein YncE